jgi:hypothetical protein
LNEKHGDLKEHILKKKFSLVETAEESVVKIQGALELSASESETKIGPLQKHLDNFGISAFENQFQKEFRRFVRS